MWEYLKFYGEVYATFFAPAAPPPPMADQPYEE